MLFLLKSRQTWLLVIGAGIVTFAAILLILAAPKPGVTRENFQRLRVGMKESDVEGVLGTSGWKWLSLGGSILSVGPYVKEWNGEEITIVLTFNPDTEEVVAGFSRDANGHHCLENDAEDVPPVDNAGYKLGVNIWPQAP